MESKQLSTVGGLQSHKCTQETQDVQQLHVSNLLLHCTHIPRARRHFLISKPVSISKRYKPMERHKMAAVGSTSSSSFSAVEVPFDSIWKFNVINFWNTVLGFPHKTRLLQLELYWKLLEERSNTNRLLWQLQRCPFSFSIFFVERNKKITYWKRDSVLTEDIKKLEFAGSTPIFLLCSVTFMTLWRIKYMNYIFHFLYPLTFEIISFYAWSRAGILEYKNVHHNFW